MPLIYAEPGLSCRDKGRALRDAITILSGKWKVCIIQALWDGERRFTDLQEFIEGITPKVLTRELQELEMNYMVTRTVQPTKPITVTYALTAHAHSTRKVFESLLEFGMIHRKVVIGKIKTT